MTNSSLTRVFNTLKNVLVYKPPDTAQPFVLEETSPQQPETQAGLQDAAAELDATLRLARRVERSLDQTKTILTSDPSPDKIKAVQKEVQSLEAQTQEISPIPLSYITRKDVRDQSVSASLDENILLINKIFELPDNKDFVIRQFFIPMKPPLRAALLFSKTLVDKKDVNSTILTPLFNAKNIEALNGDVLTILATQVLPVNQVQPVQDFPSIIKAVQAGDTVLFADGSAGAIIIETKGFEHRGISTPRIEQTVRGNQSAFTETLLINISLVRLTLRAPDLVTDMVTIGARSQTDCAIMYLQSVVNRHLVAEVKRRLSNISTDYIAAGALEQFIEDHPGIPLPQILSTERPDRVSSHLAEGRVAILLDGDPFALVVPISFFTLLHSPEDFALKPPSAVFMRLLRITAFAIATLFPSIYIALVYYHPEAMPTDLLLAIAGAREQIPFPAIVETFIMELSFEFTREASLRKPGLLGETIGVVGGIILGQAVVTANLISPITVVVVAITALASFGIPDYRVGMVARQVRFAFLLMAAVLGLLGVAGLAFIGTIIMCSMKSFGVPFFTPLAPKTKSWGDTIFRTDVFNQEQRPDQLNTREQRRQPPISRKWTKGQP